jgi:hypothetical protein
MRQRFRLVAVSFFIFCNVCLLYPQQKTPTQVVEDFELQGTACQCTANACPCQKNGAPNHGTDFVHIRTGRYGKLHLDGLNAVVVRNLVDKNAARLYATIYVDQNADSAQRDALTAILQFLNGAYETSTLQASQVKVVPMVFTESTDRTTYTLDIPGILEERASLRRDASGKPLSNVTAMDDWSNTQHNADNESPVSQWHGWHAFCRGLATNLHDLGVDHKTIQAILRHSNVALTMNIT